MHDSEEEDSLFISLTLETKIVRVIGASVVPSKLVIKADVSPVEDMSDEEMTLAMTKIRFWFDNIVQKCIVFSYDNEIAMAMLINEEGRNRTSNVLMITPGEPNDEVLATVFQAKLCALSSEKITFALMEVKSDNPLGLSFVFVGDSRETLPNMEQWIGKRSYFKEPWWCRDDASTLDVAPPPDADLSKKPAWAFSLDGVTGVRTDVIRPDFKPTVIDGGKKK